MDALLGFSFAVYAVYALVVLLTSPGDALNGCVTDWLYQGLFAGAVVIAAARAVHVEQDRLAWSVIAAVARVDELRGALLHRGRAGGLPVRLRHRSGSPSTRWRTSAWCCSCDGARRRSRGRSGSTGSPRPSRRRRSEPRSCSRSCSPPPTGSRRGARDEPRLPPRRRVAALRRVRCLLARGLADRTALAVARRSASSPRRSPTAIYLFTVDTYRAGSAIDVLWPLSSLLIATSAWVRAHDERHARTSTGGPSSPCPRSALSPRSGSSSYDHFERVNLLAVGLAAVTLRPRARPARADVP